MTKLDFGRMVGWKEIAWQIYFQDSTLFRAKEGVSEYGVGEMINGVRNFNGDKRPLSGRGSCVFN